MKCVIVNKNPFGITEIADVVGINSIVPDTAITTAVVISYKVGASTLTRTVSTNDAMIQIME